MSISQGQWLAHFDRHSKSNLSIKAYCRKFRLRECQWFYWRRKLTSTPSQPDPGAGNSFVPVEIHRQGPTELSITLKSGIVIHVPAHTDPGTISRTIQVIMGAGL